MNQPFISPCRERTKHGFFRGGATRVKGRAKLDSDSCTIRFSSKMLPDAKDSPIYEVHADIYSPDSSVRIGYMYGFVITTYAVDFDVDELFYICDAHSQTLCNFAEELVTSKFDLSEHCEGEALFYFELLELLPEHQHRGLGISAYRMLEGYLCQKYGIRVTIFKPHPLQYESPFPVNNSDVHTLREYNKALKKLRKYYTVTLGAVKLSHRSTYYYAYPQIRFETNSR